MTAPKESEIPPMSDSLLWLIGVQAALVELKRCIKERKARIESGATLPWNALQRLDAMETAYRILNDAQWITYFETNGTPTSKEYEQSNSPS